ncbi:hypothetical protein [Nostoc sp.]
MPNTQYFGFAQYKCPMPSFRNYSYFQVNRPRGRGTAMLCPYDRCGSNT